MTDHPNTRELVRSLLEAVEFLAYERAGQFFVGVQGDSDVTADIAGPVAEARVYLAAPRCRPGD
jgi:hypothetical protein